MSRLETLRDELKKETLKRATPELAADLLRQIITEVIKGKKKRQILILNFKVGGSVAPHSGTRGKGTMRIGDLLPVADGSWVKTDDEIWTKATQQLLAGYNLKLNRIRSAVGEEQRWSRPDDLVVREDYFPVEGEEGPFFIVAVREYHSSRELSLFGVDVAREVPKKK